MRGGWRLEARRGAARRGVTLLELMIATGALMMVLGPLFYTWHVGNQTTNAAHSAAMLSALTAMEFIRHDLDQHTHADGPADGADGLLPLISGPGPDDGSQIAFYVPKVRPPGTKLDRQLELVPVSYALRPIPNTATYHLIRKDVRGERALGGVVLRRLFFNRLKRAKGAGPDSQPEPGFEDVVLPHDMVRVSLIAAEKAATEEQMDRTDVRRVQTYAVSFVQSVQEPSLVNRLRMPTQGDRYQFLRRNGRLNATP